MHSREQTIFALSSGRPPSAIAIVRVSGPQAKTVLEVLAGRVPRPRMATRALLRDREGQGIDDAVVLWFPGPASATGEDVAEFHIHGSRAVQAALFTALSCLENVRAAEPGEFTRRAFENGKLDLTEAEALDDLIHADTDRQRRQALRQLQGLLGDKARDWRKRIIEVQLDLDGYPMTLIDTAGIRDTEDPVEQEGVRRARLRAAESDLVLWVTDAEHEQSEKVGTSAATMWVVRNKIDLDSVGEPAGTGTAIQPGQGSQ